MEASLGASPQVILYDLPGKVINGVLHHVPARMSTDSDEYDPFLEVQMSHGKCQATMAIAMWATMSPAYMLRSPRFYCKGGLKSVQKKYVEYNRAKPDEVSAKEWLNPTNPESLFGTFHPIATNQFSALRYNKQQWSEAQLITPCSTCS